MKRFFYLAVAFASLISFASCKDDDDEKEDGKQDTPVVVPEDKPSKDEPTKEPEKETDPAKILASGRVNAEDINLLGLTNGAPVDLGLSVKWATHNVGATECYDFGGYYAWGETETKEDYDVKTHFMWFDDDFYNSHYFDHNVKKGVIDDNGILTSKYDAATANWGSKFRMPTVAECKELLDFCDWHYLTIVTSDKYIKGYYVKSKSNGNAIFLPSAGRMNGTELEAEKIGYYWSSTADKIEVINGNAMIFGYSILNGSSYKIEESPDESNGYNIRPVENK